MNVLEEICPAYISEFTKWAPNILVPLHLLP